MRIPLAKPILTDEMIHAAVKALKNDLFLRGKNVEEFEKDFADYIGTKHAIAVNNGTSAFHLSLIAMGVGSGDYVITTPATFIATANAITYIGAKPIFVDISLETYNIDPQKIEEEVKKYKGKVKAIIPVHLYGYPADMDEILEIAENYGLKVLEDACQAHGAVYKNKRVGSLGDAAAFSFYPSKNMTVAGDGGMITTNDHEYIGYTARMNTVNAAIGRIQLKYLEEWNEKRRRIAREYNKRLDGIGDIILPPKESSQIRPVYHLYVIRTKHRNALKNYLEKKGIQCGIHYPLPVHLQPPYRKMGFKEGLYPNAERWAKEVLSLPIFPDLAKDEIEYIVSSVEEFFKRVRA